MSKKQKRAVDVKQPLTEDFYSVSEGLIEDVPLTREVQEELLKLAQCYRKQRPENRVKHWTEYKQSQTVERSSESSEAEEKPKSRVEEVKELGPLARVIHYPLTPVKTQLEANVSQEFRQWLNSLPYLGMEEVDSFKFLPSAMQPSFEFLRLKLEARLDTILTKVELEEFFKAHGFTRFDSHIEAKAGCVFYSFQSPQFYVVAAFDKKATLLNYFVTPS